MNHEKLIDMLPRDLRAIAEIVGLEAALKIGRRFRSTWVYVGELDHIEREIRDEKIREQYDAGTSARDLALKNHLSERQIWNILGKVPEDPEPLPLFDRLLKKID